MSKTIVTNDNMVQFMDVLFDPEDNVFVANDLYTGQVVNKKDVLDGQFFCLNACINGRKKSDITKFRNFLLEIDEIPGSKEAMPHREQIDLIWNKYQIPFSTAVNSGNKSIHFIVSLQEPLKGLEEYEFIANWLKKIITEADKSVLVPEKLSRLIGGINQKTMREQKGHITKNGRVPNNKFLDWLNLYPHARPLTALAKETAPSRYSNRDGITSIVYWYITEYLGRSYNNIRGHYQCPVCASEGCDTSEDNMYVSGPTMKFNCFAVKEHNQVLFRELRSLYYKQK